MLVVVDNASLGFQRQSTDKLVFLLRGMCDEVHVVGLKEADTAIKCPDVTGIVLSGSDIRISDRSTPEEVLRVTCLLLKCSKPILGVCFGHQILARLHDGVVEPIGKFRYGDVAIASGLLGGEAVVREQHNDAVTAAPPGWVVMAQTGAIVEEMRHPTKPWYGVQYHPELSGDSGINLLRWFVSLTQ